MKKRYPGPMPFSYDDRNLFFGRDQEIDYLTTLIINNQITILHGKSGYGKSSLINAGLIPNLLESFNCEIIRIRLYNYDKAHPMQPLETFLKTIQQHVSGAPYLDGLLGVDHPSAWRYFKKLQYGNLKNFSQDAEGNTRSQLSYVLVIDQFEELFTYPKESVIELAKAFQEILLHRIPEEYQDSLKESFRDRGNLEAYKDELSILDKDIPLKVIFSLRTERFNYLTHLVNYIPTLLNNTYKVRRMTALQVREAIVNPALVVDDEFNSPPYTYESEIVEKLIDFLDADTKWDNSGGKIEVFEMQIICQKLETLLIEHLARAPVQPEQFPVLFQEDLILQSPDIKDKQNPFAEIIKNYYKETIETITEPVDRLSARYLIEFKLIDQATNNRISLDNAFVQQIGISDAVLRHLIDQRIIRVEINTVSGHSLEISHDSLVMPILNAAAELGSLAVKLSEFYEAAIAGKSKSGKAVRDIINDVLLEETETKDAAAATLNDDDMEMLRHNPVIVEKSKGKSKEMLPFGVKKIFQQTAQQSRAKAQQSSTKGWVKRFAIASVVFVAVIVFLLTILSLNKRREQRLSALLFLNIVDTIPNKKDALQLVYYIYQQEVLYNRDSLILKKKLQDLLHTQDIQSMFSFLSITMPSSDLKREEIDLSQSGDFSIYHYKTTEGDEPSGRYYLCNKKGDILKQFENVLYTYFTNRKDIAILARAGTGSDSIYSNTNKFARAFVLFNCNTGGTEIITLLPGHYLYPPDVGTPYQSAAYNMYRVHFDASGDLVVPIYDPSSAAHAQQTERISSAALNSAIVQASATDSSTLETASNAYIQEVAYRVKQFVQNDQQEVIGVNAAKKTIVYKSKNDYDASETLYRRSLEGADHNYSFTYTNGIQSAAYNAAADATLVYTRDNKLYLLDSTLQIKAGFQLTTNDLYGFAGNGNRFFYVRNEALSFFDNNNELINLFDYEQSRQWLHDHFTNRDKTSLQKLRKQYELDF